jgi:hypothetical protein
VTTSGGFALLFGGLGGLGAVEALEGEDYAVGPPPLLEVTLIEPEDFDYEPEVTGEDAERAKPIDDAVAPLNDLGRGGHAMRVVG